MARTLYAYLLSLACFLTLTLGQADVSQCAVNCLADVSGTNCTQADFSCLCLSDVYLNRVNSCTQAACNSTDYQIAIDTFAQLCAVLGIPLNVQPFATVSISSGDSTFSTQVASLSNAVVANSTSVPSATILTGTATPTTSLTSASTSKQSTTASSSTQSSTATASAATSSNIASNPQTQLLASFLVFYPLMVIMGFA